MIRNDTQGVHLQGRVAFLLIFPLLLCVENLPGAEIRGIVRVERSGLFGNAHTVSEAGLLSVSVFPLHGVPPVATESTTHRVEIRDKQISPLYLAVRRGDRIRFENHDNVHHQLFSLSTVEPFVLNLAKQSAGKDSAGEIRLDHSATVHIFCRIHARAYGRIDVLDTPYITMVRPGEAFEFRGLSPGKWRLRIALPGAETQSLETLAMTSPPLLRETLVVRQGSLAQQGYSGHRVGLADLYPEEPGM